MKHPRHPSKTSSAKVRTPTTQKTSTRTKTTTATSTTTPRSSSAPSSITLDLIGRSGDASSSVCGATRHYRTYAAGQVIGISGRVSPIPSAIWKVKVKIEVCAGSGFSDYVKIEATLDKHRGTFSGSFPAPAAGFYRARAELYVNDTRTTDSTDVHFETR